MGDIQVYFVSFYVIRCTTGSVAGVLLPNSSTMILRLLTAAGHLPMRSNIHRFTNLWNLPAILIPAILIPLKTLLFRAYLVVFPSVHMNLSHSSSRWSSGICSSSVFRVTDFRFVSLIVSPFTCNKKQCMYRYLCQWLMQCWLPVESSLHAERVSRDSLCLHLLSRWDARRRSVYYTPVRWAR